MLSIIVAVAKNGVIGKDNKLIWHMPKDLKFFKETTNGHVIIMGRNTLESLPFLLPNRTHWVVTRNKNYVPPYEGVRVFHSAEEVMQAAAELDHAYIIGGAQVYKQFINLADELLVTEIDQDFEGDVSFPPINPKIFTKVQTITGEVDEKNPWPFNFVTYRRKEL